MKKMFCLIAFIVVLFIPIAMIANASPFLKADSQAGVEYYTITGDAFFESQVTASVEGSMSVDLAGIPSGSHTIAVSACNLWGCSATVPFTFNKSAPPTPAGLKIVR